MNLVKFMADLNLIYLIDYIIMAVVIIAAAIMALEAKEIVHAIFFFDIFTIGIGGMFLLFNAGFVAIFQLAVYAGAIAVIVLFAVMLTRREATGKEVISFASWRTRLASIFLVLTIAALMVVLVYQMDWATTSIPYPETSSSDLFNYITEHFAAVFMAIGVLLSTALLGGLALLRGQRKFDAEEEEVVTQ